MLSRRWTSNPRIPRQWPGEQSPGFLLSIFVWSFIDAHGRTFPRVGCNPCRRLPTAPQSPRNRQRIDSVPSRSPHFPPSERARRRVPLHIPATWSVHITPSHNRSHYHFAEMPCTIPEQGWQGKVWVFHFLECPYLRLADTPRVLGLLLFLFFSNFFFFTESGEEGSARADTGSPSVWLFPATHSCWHMGDHVLQNWSGEALRDGTMWVGYVRGYIRRYFDVKAHIGPWCGALPRVTRFGIMDHGAGVLSVPDSRGWTLLGRIRLNRARKGSFQCLR